jgi:hypothetical protein
LVRSIVKSPPLLLAALLVAGMVIAAGLWLPGQAGAQASNTAERSIPAAEVMPGAELVVTIEHNIGVGGIVETLPPEFEYVDESVTAGVIVNESGQDLIFAVLRAGTFTYTVTTSDTEGPYTFEGRARPASGNNFDVTGDTDIEVAADAPEVMPTEEPTAEPTEAPSGERGPRGRTGDTGDTGPQGEQGRRIHR